VRPRAMWTEQLNAKANRPDAYRLVHGSGGHWDNEPRHEPVAVIHLPDGSTHEVHAEPRRRLGFR
jgi:hypothetical protein